jgi:hypothetical protein
VDVDVDETGYGVLVDGERWWLPLTGIIQVFPSEDHATWIVLHLTGPAVTIPAGAITTEQIDYLKGFARRAAEQRRAAQFQH